MAETITSAQNPKVRKLLALQQKAAERRESGLFVLEGVRELRHCLSAGYKAEYLFVCPEILGCRPDAEGLMSSVPSDRVFEVPKELYARIAYRGGTEGIIAEVRAKERGLESLKLPPGNLGAMFRSCDAAGADAMIICGPDHTDLYNPNLIRASVGAVFTVPCAVCGSEEAIAFLRGLGVRILTAQLQDSSLYYDCDMRRGTALVMGAEDTGLSDIWRRAADAHIRIPMLGRLDSLNVSVSAAVLLFEAVRQRKNIISA